MKKHGVTTQEVWAAQVVWRAMVDIAHAYDVVAEAKPRTPLRKLVLGNQTRKLRVILNRAVLDGDDIDNHDVLRNVYEILEAREPEG